MALSLVRGAGLRGDAAAPPVALSFDARQSSMVVSSVDPWPGFNFTYNVATDMVVVGVSWESSTATIAGVTLGGVAMTRVANSVTSQAGVTYAEFFYILADTLPAGGVARSIVVDPSASCGGHAYAWSFAGAQQVAPGAGSIGGVTSANSVTATRNGVLANSILLGGSNMNTTGTGDTLTPNTGWTERYDAAGAAGGQAGWFGEQGPVTAGDYSLTLTRASGNSRIASSVIEIFD